MGVEVGVGVDVAVGVLVGVGVGVTVVMEVGYGVGVADGVLLAVTATDAGMANETEGAKIREEIATAVRTNLTLNPTFTETSLMPENRKTVITVQDCGEGMSQRFACSEPHVHLNYVRYVATELVVTSIKPK